MSLAYRGRHRRLAHRTLVKRTAVATGGVAVAIAVPAIGGTAHAASSSDWDRLAQCESTGNWHINTGNSFYGGVQFTASTWRAYGGGQYAPRADLASKDEQKAVANRVLKGQGWNAWPTCSRKVGLYGTPTTGGSTTPARASRSATRAPVAAAHAVSRPAGAKSYVVHRGDTLSKIAKRFHVKGGWKHLYTTNKKILGANPNHIKVGQHLTIG